MNSYFVSPEEILEKGKSVVKQQVQLTSKAISSQVAGTGQKPQPQGDPAQNQAAQDASTKDFLKDMYGTSHDGAVQPQQASHQSQSLGAAIMTQFKGVPAEDAEKMARVRKELIEQHKESYYNPLVTKPKQEERPADKIEREENEEKQKRWELQKKQEKERPLGVTMATNKAEQFRDSAG